MLLPHQKDFQFRRHAFWAMSLIAITMGYWTSGLTGTQFIFIALSMLVMAAFAYFLTWAVVRSDATFRDVHPRKIIVTSLFAFYVPVALSAALLIGSPCIPDSLGIRSSIERVVYFLLVPCLMASAAGADRGYTSRVDPLGEPKQ